MKRSIVYRELKNDLSDIKLVDHPLLNRIYLTRGVTQDSELEKTLNNLHPFQTLQGIGRAVARLYQALAQQQHIMVIGDYDTDGATSTAIAVRALRGLGAKQVSYLVPNRFEYGYGLSEEIVQLAKTKNPDLLITVDNGIVSFEGVNLANELGMDVIITDHHLAAEQLPNACAIVNPNQPGDNFPSKCLAGCGVVFYVMIALRAHLREQDWFAKQQLPEFNLAQLLDLVALGTVADVVPLDKNNRALVFNGLQRIRSGHCIPGIKALLRLGKRQLPRLVAADLGFAVAPRLNAAGRLEDMSIGVECLLTDDEANAMRLAAELDRINSERRVIEAKMKQQAFTDLQKLPPQLKKQHAICLYNSTWHQGVIGILASRIKDHYHRPSIIFAAGNEGELKGSARSISGFHIRDALERISLTHPKLLKKYGGHAMAAGLTIAKQDFKLFKQVLEEDVIKQLKTKDLENTLTCDAELNEADLSLSLAQLLRESGPWGQGFPEPIFANHFNLVDQRLVAEKHLKLTLGFNDKMLDAILFNADLERWPNYRCKQVLAAYRLDVNEYMGRKSLQLMIDYLEPI